MEKRARHPHVQINKKNPEEIHWQAEEKKSALIKERIEILVKQELRGGVFDKVAEMLEEMEAVSELEKKLMALIYLVFTLSIFIGYCYIE